jgi:cyclopropane fatty-acyl-phospholipid synthase-like methyltransferase
MTIDDHVLEAMVTRPALHHNLNHYAETGLKDYAKMIEFDLKIIKQNYGQDVYNKLNHIYQGIREVFDGGS